MRRHQRTRWLDVRLKVCFEEAEMQVLVRNGGEKPHLEKRVVVTPVFLLPDGAEFTGRRASQELRERIEASAGKGPRT
jgi:hypothetical protein